MPLIPSALRVLTGAIVLLGAALFLSMSGDSVNAEILLAMAPQEKKKCVTIGEKRVCFEDDAKNRNDDDDDDDKPKKKKTGNKCQGEISCPAGYVVLDKPNKYGACCEPKEGLPAPASTEKCKFPGEVGTPPNCHCPGGTEFVGYKGCVKVEVKKECIEVPPAPITQDERNRFDKEWAQIRDNCPKSDIPVGCIGKTCCCKYKVYAN
jgi:hypothetical protein